MIEPAFACSEGCSSMELGPDLGPSTKPCDCWNAEINKLRARVAVLEAALPDPDIIRMFGKRLTCATGNTEAWIEACRMASAIERAKGRKA